MAQFGDGNSGRQADSIKRIIDRALVQCYALEGIYPSELDYVENYGVILDRDRYIYHYEYMTSNLRPLVMVFDRR